MRKLINRYNMEILVLGCGSDGARIYIRKEDKIYHLKAAEVGPVINTVGAGDALFSSFIHFYAKGYDPIESLELAQVFAAYKIGFSGGAKGFVSEEKVLEIMHENSGDK